MNVHLLSLQQHFKELQFCVARYALYQSHAFPKPFTADQRAASAEQLGVQWLVQSHLDSIRGNWGELFTHFLSDHTFLVGLSI